MARLLIFLFLIPSLSCALTIHCDYFAPLHYKNALNGEFTGFSVELLKMLSKESGVNYELYMGSRKKNLELLRAGEIDAVLSLERTEDIEKDFQWVGPYISNDWVLVGKRNISYRLGYLKEAASYKVILKDGDSFKDLLSENGFNPRSVISDKKAALELKNNTADLWATGSIVVDHVASALRFTNYKIALTARKNIFIYMAFKKNADKEVVNKLNVALRKFRLEGNLSQLREKYFKN